jgi:hypothetical protein
MRVDGGWLAAGECTNERGFSRDEAQSSQDVMSVRHC